MAGAALTTLDMLVRSDPAWAGAWRQRLALKCAAAAVRLAGRNEDQAALRDAWVLRQPGDAPGPAGTCRYVGTRGTFSLASQFWDDGDAHEQGSARDTAQATHSEACGRDWACCEDLPVFWDRSQQLLPLA
ncbi:DUF1403 family protein [Mesorhizobium sp. A556]